MAPAISVIVPSALRHAPDGRPWLVRALASIRKQTLRPKEVVIGVDPDQKLYPPFTSHHCRGLNAKAACGAVKGHQSACNAAVRFAGGRLLAFLEDDDVWERNHLELLAGTMERLQVDFVSASQVEVDPQGNILAEAVGGEASEGKAEGEAAPRPRVFDFPTASGWLVSKLVWMQVGGFNERLKIHHDNAFLGELNRRGVPRAHVVEAGPAAPNRPALASVARHARVVQAEGLELPTVRRTVHEGSIMGGVALDPERAALSAREYAWCQVEYGYIPW